MVIRTNVADGQKRDELKVLIESCATVVRRAYAENQWSEAELSAQADLVAHDAVAQYDLKPERLRRAFTTFVAKPARQEERDHFIAELFQATWDLDIDAVLNHGLSTEELFRVAAEVGFAAPERSASWYDMSAEQVIDTHHEIDPRRLRDPNFRRSDEGQKLERVYTQLFGRIKFEQYRRLRDGAQEHERQPLIPLAEVPLIEGFFIAAVGTDRFTELSSRPLVTLVLQSTSLSARQALVESVARRFPKGERASFHGETEFQFKREQIVQLLKQYQHSIPNENHRALHLNDLLPVVEAFTGSGAILEDLRAPGASRDARVNRNLADFKEITKLLLTEGLGTTEQKLTGLLEAEVQRLFNPPQSSSSEPWNLTHEEAALVWFDALGKVNVDSMPEVFSRVGRVIFAPYGVWGRQHDALAQMMINAKRLESTPNVKSAHEALQEAKETGSGTSAVAAAQESYDHAMFRARLAYSSAAERKNSLVFALLDRTASTLVSTPSSEPAVTAAGGFFLGLVSNIELPKHAPLQINRRDYQHLIKIARRPDLSAHLQAKICWRIQKQLRDLPADQVEIKRRAVLDMFEIAFDSPHATATVDSLRVVYLLRPAAEIVRQAGPNLFDGIPEEFVVRLGNYAVIAQAFAEQTEATRGESPEAWGAFENGRTTVKLISSVEDRYDQYVQLERIRREPAEYYQWLVSRLKPVAHALDIELKFRGDRDQPTELVELRGLLCNFEKEHIPRETTPADAELLKETGLGEFLAEFCERIHPMEAIPSSRGWEYQCLDFKREAVQYLPSPLFEQLVRREPRHSPLGQTLAARAEAKRSASTPPGPTLA